MGENIVFLSKEKKESKKKKRNDKKMTIKKNYIYYEWVLYSLFLANNLLLFFLKYMHIECINWQIIWLQLHFVKQLFIFFNCKKKFNMIKNGWEKKTKEWISSHYSDAFVSSPFRYINLKRWEIFYFWILKREKQKRWRFLFLLLTCFKLSSLLRSSIATIVSASF